MGYFKKLTYGILSAVVALNACSVTAFAAEQPVTQEVIMVREVTQDYVDAKFEELFPEYQAQIAACDSVVEYNRAMVTRGMEMSVQRIGEDEVTEIENITKVDGADVYNLVLYSNGGYAKAAILQESVSIDFQKGSETATECENCKVYTHLSDPGLFTYTGGMIGDSISYYKSGTFKSNGYGRYVNAGVMPGYEDYIDTLSKGASSISVAGVATSYISAGEYIQEVLTKRTVLKIQLVRNGNPTITFGYL